ncbi:hypothetical protein GGI12_001587 [Dipsacomyces acuminosporus]|nr:hypothetical protein GGI12_001587 [Dipsacomyces acuminosporus]
MNTQEDMNAFHSNGSDELDASLDDQIAEKDESEEAADAELEELRRVRRALSKMNHGIENVQHQIKYFNSNVSQTTQLLDIWVRILSQTAHSQAFLANEEWQGGAMDTVKLNDLVQRDIQRQEEAERREREEEARREMARAEEKERERQRAEAAAAATAASTGSRPPTRPGIRGGRRAPPGYARGSSASGARGGPASSATRGGRGSGRGRAAAPTASSRIRPPR